MLQKGDIIYHRRTMKEWKVVSVENTQYDQKLKLKSLSSLKSLTKKLSDLDDYKTADGEWVNDRCKPNSKYYYTDEEKTFIVENYGLMKLEQLAQKINRDPKCVVQMAYNLRRTGTELATPKYTKGV